MISYEIYKIIHLTCIMLTFTAMSIQLVGEKDLKIFKIIAGISSFLILVSGMGLLARVGVTHGNIPTWGILKILIWLILAVGLPVAGKRLKQYGLLIYWIAILLFFLAAIIINYRV